MLKSLPATLLTLLAGAALGYGLQDHGKAGQDHGKKQDHAAAPEMAMPKPGPEHAMLMKSVGTWDAKVHSMGQESKGVQVTSALGQFFVVDEFKGEFGGMPFAGRGINGYDPIKKQFVSMWADSMSPSPTVAEPEALAARRSLPSRRSALAKTLASAWLT